MKSLLSNLLNEALTSDRSMAKTAAAETPPVNTDEMLKLADGLEHIAQAFDNVGPDEGDPMGAVYPERWIAQGETTPALPTMPFGQAMVNPPGQLDQVTEGEREVDNLGGSFPESNEGEWPGMTSLASLRKNAQTRASAAMDRVLGRIKAASMRRMAAEDPAMQDNLPAEASQAGEPPTTPPAPPSAEIPQTMESIMSVTNTEADAGNRAEENAVLGSEVTRSADESDPAGDVLAHESGDEEPNVKAASQQARILRRALLANIAGGG